MPSLVPGKLDFASRDSATHGDYIFHAEDAASNRAVGSEDFTVAIETMTTWGSLEQNRDLCTSRSPSSLGLILEEALLVVITQMFGGKTPTLSEVFSN